MNKSASNSVVTTSGTPANRGTTAAGRAVYSTNTLSVGLHTVSATYDGDGGFNASTRANRNQRIR